MNLHTSRRRGRAFVLCLIGLTGLTGCGWSGLNDQPLPFAKGNGDGAITLIVEMENAVNLVPNSEVKVDEVTVGSVRRIKFRNWHAELTIGLEKGVELPANATARIGQKSLLGAEYVELSAPTIEPARGNLTNGSVIPMHRTGRYPETEELFSALSTVLNGGGLAQVATITTELNNVLGGREADVRDLLKQLNVLIGTLDGQRGQILAALRGLNRLSGSFARQQTQLAHALDTLPRAVDVLQRERPELTRTLNKLATFGEHSTRLIDANKTALRHNLVHLRPILAELANAGTALTNFLADATFPFPVEGLLKSAKGDYLNLFLTVDLTTKAITRDFLGGISPLDAVYGGLTGTPPSQTATGAANPLELPQALTQILKNPARKTPVPAPTAPDPSTEDSPGSGGLLGELIRGLS